MYSRYLSLYWNGSELSFASICLDNSLISFPFSESLFYSIARRCSKICSCVKSSRAPPVEGPDTEDCPPALSCKLPAAEDFSLSYLAAAPPWPYCLSMKSDKPTSGIISKTHGIYLKITSFEVIEDFLRMLTVLWQPSSVLSCIHRSKALLLSFVCSRIKAIVTLQIF